MANSSTLDHKASPWGGGEEPMKASYGKLMMWFFLVSDAFTFSTLLIVYGCLRFATGEVEWANPEVVFTHFPVVTEFFGMHPPLAFVGLMTFILIFSSVTMVLAVEAGHRMDKKQVGFYMILTIIGGAAFVSCQAYEWYNFIVGSPNSYLRDVFENGELVTRNFVGANLQVNQYSANPLFANLFFFITGFHGTHVLSGVIINILIYKNTMTGVYEKRGHYEMVEKAGLYWHFVDLVWVFVFTFFYLL